MLRLRRFGQPSPAPELPHRLSVEIGGRQVDVDLRHRPTARRMTLRVSSATGGVMLTLPPGVPLRGAQTFLDSHAGWIGQRLSRLPDRTTFLPGAVVPLRGSPHRIVHWSRVRGTTRRSLDETGEPVIAVCGDESAVPGRVRRFLAVEAEADLREAVLRHTAALGVAARRISLRDTRSRWGSCSSTGALSFSWRLILAPPFVLDYLAAHEVAHLKEMNHSHRFWRLVHGLCPRTEEAERWLNRHGSGLHRYG
jgi:predicted metal-dependent hydrolase